MGTTTKNKEGELGLRIDGRIKWICEHGVGHTVWVPPQKTKGEEDAWWVHGCDGCCESKECREVEKRLKKALKYVGKKKHTI